MKNNLVYRTNPLDFKTVFENIVQGMCSYLTEHRINAMVLGISGGIDSTLTAAIAKEVNTRTDIPLIGISLPCSTNMADENEAAQLVMEEFCNEHSTCYLEDVFAVMNEFCEQASKRKETPISQGNVKARLRMITLYDIASKIGGVVLDTDNLTEHFLGFFTLHGDCADLNPIGCLWKNEVYGLAKWLKDNVYPNSKALEASIKLIPTDGNGVKAGGDLAQIAPNKTYDDVDEILQAWVGMTPTRQGYAIANDFMCDELEGLNYTHGFDIVKGVITRSINSEFKRGQAPYVIDIYNKAVLEKNLNPIEF